MNDISMNCKNCGQELNSDKKFCGNCGQKVHSEGIECPGCKTVNSVNTKFCTSCGRNLHSSPKTGNDATTTAIPVADNSTNSQIKPLLEGDNATIFSVGLIILCIWFFTYSPSSNVNKTISSYEIVSLQAKWKSTSQGLNLSDGMLYVPEIQMTVKNSGKFEIEDIRFKVVFLDDNGVITSDSTGLTGTIPPGYVKGPIFISGSVGYTNSIMPFNVKWRFDLFVRNSYSAPWTKIKSGVIENLIK